MRLMRMMKLYMAAADLELEEVAFQIGVKKPTLVAFIKGTRKVRPANVGKIISWCMKEGGDFDRPNMPTRVIYKTVEPVMVPGQMRAEARAKGKETVVSATLDFEQVFKKVAPRHVRGTKPRKIRE